MKIFNTQIIKTFIVTSPSDVPSILGGLPTQGLYFDLSFDPGGKNYHLISSKGILFHEEYEALDHTAAIASAKARLVAVSKGIVEHLLND
jgi:hypothetical protein